MERKIELAEPCGFCSGVRNALRLIDATLSRTSGAPVYVLRGLIHNTGVTEKLRERGCVFVENVAEIPVGATAVFGAHGVGGAVVAAARERRLVVTDATCPLVKQLQQAAAAVTPERELVLFGHRGHPEVEGVVGHSGTARVFVIENVAAIAALPDLRAPVLLVQTTLSHIEADKVKRALQERFPRLECGHGICDASLRRQQAVEQLAARCDLVVVVGSAHSSNANRLRESAAGQGARAVLIDSAAEVTPELLGDARRVGVTAGASTPEEQISAVLAALKCSADGQSPAPPGWS